MNHIAIRVLILYSYVKAGGLDVSRLVFEYGTEDRSVPTGVADLFEGLDGGDAGADRVLVLVRVKIFNSVCGFVRGQAGARPIEEITLGRIDRSVVGA